MAKAIKTAIIAAAVTFVTIVTAGAALTALGLGGTAIAGTLTASGFALGSAIVTGVGTLIASGIGMLTSRGIEATRENFGTKLAGRSGQAPRQVVYGECRVGGTVVKMHTSGTENNKLHLAIVLAGHEIQSLEKVYLNDEPLTVSSSTESGETVYTVTNANYTNTENDNAFTGGRLIRYTFHDGSQTTVDGVANAASSGNYPTTAKFQGMAYVYMEFIYDSEKNARFPSLWFHVKGKKVYDPRTATTAYSNNPALIIRDFLTDTLYGLKATSSEINDGSSGDVGSFYEAADICDETVSLPDSASESRYTANGFTNSSASLDGVLEGLLSSCSGHITYTNGQFNLFVGGDQAPTLTITDDDLLGAVNIETKAKGGELYNAIKSIYVDASQRWQGVEAPVYEDATYLSQDTPSGESSDNYKKMLEIQLPFTSTHTMAQRLQTIVLNRQRQSLMISCLTTLKYMQVQPGDWVQLTNERMGYTNKKFEVLSATMEFLDADGVVAAATRLVLQEIDDTIYDYAASDYLTPQDEGADPDLGDLSIGAPSGLTLTQVSLQEGTNAKIGVKVSWTNSGNQAVQGTEIQYRLGTETDADYRTAATAGKGVSALEFPGAVVGQTYYVRIRHFSFDNVNSSWTAASTITISEPDAISAPTSVSATTGSPGSIVLGFTAPSEASVTAVRVYYSTTSGFTPSASNLLTSISVGFDEKRRHAVGKANGLAYDTTYYFKLTAVNSYGTESSASSQVSGSFTPMQSIDIEDQAISIAKFASSIEPITLVTTVPGTKSTETIYNTTDNTLYRWDGTQYVSAQGATTFSELSGQLAAGQAAVNSIQSSAIQAAAITETKIGTNAVSSGKIQAGAVIAGKIGASAVTATEIAANTITAAEIAANTITANQIASQTITASQIASNTITAGQIAAGAISATEIAAGSISVDRLASSSTSVSTGLTFGLGSGMTVNGYTAAGIFKTTTSSGMGLISIDDGGGGLGIAAGTTSTAGTDFGVIGYGALTYSGGTYGSSSTTTVGSLGAGTVGGYFNYGNTHHCHASTSSYSLSTSADIYCGGSYLPFTGSHICLIDKTESVEAGDILVDVEVVASLGVSDTITKATKATSSNQKGAIGVYKADSLDQEPELLCDITQVEDSKGVAAPQKSLKQEYVSTMQSYTASHANGVGEGLINVCGQNGDIEAGDLIVASDMAGKGMKQADDIVRGYTVAKAREGVTFADAADTAQIACVYLCG